MSLQAPPSEAGSREEDDHADLDGYWLAFRSRQCSEAREAIFQRYFPYAKGIAAAMHAASTLRTATDFNDVTQLACVGLLESIDRFDPARNVSFKTYCTSRIRGAILSGMGKFSETHEQMSFSRRMRRDRLESLTGDDAASHPFDSLTAMATGLAIGFMLDGTGMYAAHPESASPYGNGYESTAWRQSSDLLRRAVATLPDKTSKIIRYHYFELLSFEQIARILGLSKGRVSQLHRSGVKTLMKALHPSSPTAFLG